MSKMKIKGNSKNSYTVMDYQQRKIYRESSFKKCLDYIRDNSVLEKPTYYVIEDLMKWVGYPPDIQQQKIVRFKELKPALDMFKKYRTEDYNKEHLRNKEGLEYARLTLGAKIGNVEVDIVHVRNDKNYLVLDFHKIDDFNTNAYFVEDLNEINREIGLDRINIYHSPSEEEITVAKNSFLHITLIKEEIKMSEWPNDYFDSVEQGEKYFIDSDLRLVEYLHPKDTIILNSGENIFIDRVQPLIEGNKFTGQTRKNKEVSFEYQDISKLIKNRQEITPKSIEEQINDTKKAIRKIENTLNDLEKGPKSTFTESDIEYETILLQKEKKILAVLEEYKKNPERMRSVNQKLTECEMKYVKELSEKLYILSNGTLDQGFNTYLDKIKKEIEEKGYGSVVGILKDKLNAKRRDDIPPRELEISKG